MPPPPPPRSRSNRISSWDRTYDFDDNGHNKVNRRGVKLCPEYQKGNCLSLPCPIDSSYAHQCAICLDPRHGAKDCGPPSKGKGKGKKGGKKGGGKYGKSRGKYQY